MYTHVHLNKGQRTKHTLPVILVTFGELIQPPPRQTESVALQQRFLAQINTTAPCTTDNQKLHIRV